MAELNDRGRSLIEGRHYAVLGTREADGSPLLTPVWYVFRTDRIFVGSNSSSRKVRNILARPTASLVVDIRRPGQEQWVSATGSASILRGDESRRVNSEILERYLTPEALRDPRVGPAFAATDDVTICITPEKWRSWSSADLDEQFFGGVLGATPERWFRAVD
jgi:PPOX class probable F420-dependent enzyme